MKGILTDFARNIVGIRVITQILRSFFRSQRDTAMRAAVRGQPVDLMPWITPMAEAVRGPMEQVARHGIKSIQKILNERARLDPSILKPPGRPPRFPFGPADFLPPEQRLEVGFNIKLPAVDTYIQRMTVQFAESTNATSAYRTDEAAALFRRELAEGLNRGEAHAKLFERINRIYRNPARASLIAQTEQIRALAGGQWLEAKSWPGTWNKVWVASDDACEICLKLAAMEPIQLDQPFMVGPGPYGVVQHSPAHPNCRCSNAFEPA